MPTAFRYTFAFEAVNVRMLDRMTIDKHVPPSYEWKGAPAESGFWVELRDGTGAVLYRRVMDDPYYRLEGPIGVDGMLRTIAPDLARAGVFTVVVPHVPGASDLVIMASRPPDAAATPIVNVRVATPA